MMHPDAELRFVSKEIGYGVFATRAIPCGTITWALDPLDQVLSRDDLAALPPAMTFDHKRHTYIRPDRSIVLLWDLGRYINHNCMPNCLHTGLGYEVAVRDIALGEELTNDYANLGMFPDEEMRCNCDAVTCRSLITAKGAMALESEWAKLIAGALECAPMVQQPLRNLLEEPLRDNLFGG